MKKTKQQIRLDDFCEKLSLQTREGDFNRARSFTVGTSFGGTTELIMRTNDGRAIWTPMQPVEVVELIHQLSANIGCHIQLQPRSDFSSWREWRVAPEEQLRMSGHAPFVNDMAPHMQVGANLPPPEQQPGLQPALMAKETQDEQTVAIEKTL